MTELSPSLLAYLMSPRYVGSLDAVKAAYNLTEDDEDFMGDLDRVVLTGEADLATYLAVLEQRFASMPKEQRDAMYAQLLAGRFVPLGDTLDPSADEIAKEMELKLPVMPYYRVYTSPLSYSGATAEVAQMVGFALMGGPIRDRLRELVMNRASGKILDAQVRDTLTRSLEFGGLGLDPKMAERAVVSLNDLVGRAQLMSEEAYSNWLVDKARASQSETSVATASGPTSHDGAPRAIAPTEPPRAATELDGAVSQIVQRLIYKPDDDYLAKRLHNIVSSRLRDVRDASGARQLLMRDVKVGGLGLDAAAADGIMKALEAGYAEFHERIANEEKAKLDKELAGQKLKVEERRRREAEEHAKWFEDKVRARKATEFKLQPPAHPLEQKEKALQTKRFGEMVASSAAGVSSKAPVAMTLASAELTKAVKSTTRPPIDGVAYAGPQLVGLVGEIKSLSLAEFRRMSKNPQEAVKKIAQKIETLGQESLEKRIEGIKALQASPLQSAYLVLVAESFRTARPLTALAEEKRKAGQDTLSPDEIAAIISLNSALHF